MSSYTAKTDGARNQTYDAKHHNSLRHKMSNKVSNKVSKENYNLTENPNPTKIFIIVNFPTISSLCEV